MADLQQKMNTAPAANVSAPATFPAVVVSDEVSSESSNFHGAQFSMDELRHLAEEIMFNISDEVSSDVVLHRVPDQVRSRNKLIYEPLVVSLGPYHHSNNQYDDFKKKVVRFFLEPNLANEIRSRIGEIRSFYEPIPQVMGYDDEAWVEMMLRDACLVVYNMRRVMGIPKTVRHANQTIGALGATLMANDFSKLENQIPWWIVTSLITSIYGESGGNAFICKYLSYANFWDFNTVKEFSWEFPPPHLLEARRRIYLRKQLQQYVHIAERVLRFKPNGLHSITVSRSPFRSATDLRAKGIHFTKSSNFLDDISFVSHSLHGVLRLPVLRVDSETATFLSNLIVLEMSPRNTIADFPVTSYVNFMKSLIESQNDVKLLREKGIIVSYLMGNEEIVGVFKAIDTHEVDNFDNFGAIKEDINRHCNNRGKTWMAELFDTYFRSPWTALALFAAAFLLCLTFLQTFYTLNPVN